MSARAGICARLCANLWVGLLLMCASAVALAVPAVDTEAMTHEQQQRYQIMVNQLRCLVCQNQTIADSDAPLAKDLRDQVRAQILAGHSDAEITDYLTARYGDFVLYKPPFKPNTWALWVGPFVLLLAGLGAAIGVLSRRRRQAAAPTVDPERLRELLDNRPDASGAAGGQAHSQPKSSPASKPDETHE